MARFHRRGSSPPPPSHLSQGTSPSGCATARGFEPQYPTASPCATRLPQSERPARSGETVWLPVCFPAVRFSRRLSFAGATMLYWLNLGTLSPSSACLPCNAVVRDQGGSRTRELSGRSGPFSIIHDHPPCRGERPPYASEGHFFARLSPVFPPHVQIVRVFLEDLSCKCSAWRRQGSNLQPPARKAGAPPIELLPRLPVFPGCRR